jgi:hypothetical protein
MKEQLSARTQAPREPLLSFIAEIKTFHDEYLPLTPELEIVETILKAAHPDYSKYLFDKKIKTLSELREVAELIHKQVDRERSYKPPPARNVCDDPKLGYDNRPILQAVKNKKATVNQNSSVPKTGGNAQPLAKNLKCWRCKGNGHLSKDCKEKKAVTKN